MRHNVPLVARQKGRPTVTGIVYSGVYTHGIDLTNPATQETATITGTVSILNGSAVFGNFAYPWTVDNSGTIYSTGTSGTGVQLVDGGTVNNQTTGALIEGYFDGVLIKSLPGSVTNLGTIKAVGTSSTGIAFTEGGQIVNGSTSDTKALITGDNLGLDISGAVGTVSNFGTIATVSHNSSVVLFAGGVITNGATGSTSALISNSIENDIFVDNGTGAVVNFATIVGGRGAVFLVDGGSVTNGRSTGSAALIGGGTDNAILVEGGAGTVNNFGTMTVTGTDATVSIIDGGNVTNGAPTVTSALIVGTGTGVYITGAPGSVTNFGRIADTSNVLGTAVSLEDGGTLLNEGTLSTDAPATVANAVYLHDGGSVTNTRNGSVVGVIAGNGTAIGARGGGATVTNSGSIVSAADPGIYLRAGGIVTNAAGGLIAGASNGVAERGGTGTVTNAGLIRSTGDNGIYLVGGGIVTNQAGGLVEGANNGIYGRELPLTIVNAGTVESTGTLNGVYVRSGDGSIIFNQLHATIAGSKSGVYIGRSPETMVNNGLIIGGIGVWGGHSSNLTLVNSGTVASTAGTTGVAALLGDGVSDSMLVIEAGSTFVGKIDGGSQGEVEFLPAGNANVTNMYGFDTMLLGPGASHSLALTEANFSNVRANRITIVADGTVNNVNAAAVNGSGEFFIGTGGTDAFTAGDATNIFQFAASDLTAADTITAAGGYDNELIMTTPGSVVTTGVTGVEIIDLANGGANSLTLTTKNFTAVNGGFIRVFGGDDGNTINAAGVTASNDGLVIYGGAGTDDLSGGAGSNIFVFAAADLTSSDRITGGSGSDNELLMTTAGAINAAGVSGVEEFVLATGAAANTLTLTAANFAGVASKSIEMVDGNRGNTINAAALPSADGVVIQAGSGADDLIGGAGNDVFYAGGDTTMTGGGGTNQFIFDAPGAGNVIADFAASASNELVFSNAGFNLGFSGATSTPQKWTASEAATEFVADGTGSFTTTSQRLAYDTTTGNLFASTDGSGGTAHLVAQLTGDPGIAAAQLFFIT
jgi:fibronectin-binding autotransporter adhesin